MSPDAVNGENNRDDLLVNWKEQINVSVVGLPLGETEKKQLEERIQQLVTTKVVDSEQKRLQLLRTPELLQVNNNTTEVSFQGLPLSVQEKGELKAEIQQIVGTEASRQQILASAFVNISVCAYSGVPGDVITLSMTQSTVTGQPLTLDDITVIAPDRTLTASATIWLNRADLLRMFITRIGGSSNPIGSDQAVIGLANISPEGWTKRITAYNLCYGNISSVEQPIMTVAPNFMTVSKGFYATDTIIFDKPGFLGIWGSVSHWDQNEFWAVHGGSRVVYTWVLD